MRKDRALIVFDRGMMRSEFWSVFWVAMKDRGWKFADLAAAMHIPTFVVRGWFEDSDGPNFTIERIADIARALEIDLVLRFRSRAHGDFFAPHGRVAADETQRDLDRVNKMFATVDRRFMQVLRLLPKEQADALLKEWAADEDVSSTAPTPEGTTDE